MDQIIDDNTLSEISSLSEPSLDNNSVLIPATKQDLAKKKRRSSKRRTNNPKFIPEIRIFRRDIRRRYIEMLNNVLNSYDLELHRRFFEEFGNPNLIQIFNSFPFDLLEKLSQKTRLEGIDSLVEGIGRQYLAIPDIVFQLSDVKVCQRLNTPGSKIVATSMVRGTMLYSIVPTHYNHQQLSSEKKDDNLLTTSSNNQLVLKPLDEQLDYCIEGIVSISLDDQHRFITINIEAEKVEHSQS